MVLLSSSCIRGQNFGCTLMMFLMALEAGNSLLLVFPMLMILTATGLLGLHQIHPLGRETQSQVEHFLACEHMRTRKWLHSHLHASPISGNLEVSCFGGDGESDTGDYWRLEIEGSGKTWRQDQRIRLRHVDTGGYLHSHDKKYARIAGGKQEVCSLAEKRADNVWLAAEGVYLPVAGSK